MYTDNVLGASSSIAEAEERKSELAKAWDLKVVSDTYRLLGMHVEQDLKQGTVTLSQRAYFEKMLSDHDLADVHLHSTPLPVGLSLSSSMCPTSPEERQLMVRKPYRVLLGSVMWAQLATCPDLSFTISVLSQFQTNPSIEHWQALLHIMGYIRNISNLGLTFSRDAGNIVPIGYIDADYGGCQDIKSVKSNLCGTCPFRHACRKLTEVFPRARN
jgi:hypothetical protein